MKRVYKEIEKRRFEGAETQVKPGDVVILKLCTGESKIYKAVERIKKHPESDLGFSVICDGCSFEGTGTCPFRARVYTDTRYSGDFVIHMKRALEDHCLCQSQLLGGNKVIFKSVDTILEDL
jgi:hypothetical protein